ncbi:hypothetical protein [Ornithinimicrobium kibberense]|uniref:hypothetical protein n=1 Tax=Ornithinimicrobium kibberense TaxID=282060 RepID=UPI00361BAE10
MLAQVVRDEDEEGAHARQSLSARPVRCRKTDSRSGRVICTSCRLIPASVAAVTMPAIAVGAPRTVSRRPSASRVTRCTAGRTSTAASATSSAPPPASTTTSASPTSSTSSSRVPWAWTRPSSMTAIRSQRRSASSM